MSRNLAILIVIAYLAATSCKAECNLGDAMQVHEAPLPEDEDLRFDSKISKRSEGAVWSIYNDRAGKPQRLVHTDYGESGREVHRITIGDAKNYIITTHLYVYLAPLSYEGSNTIREEIDHYLFCDAKLDLPPEWDEYDKAYITNARKAADFFFTSDEIKKQLKDAGVKPPSWQ